MEFKGVKINIVAIVILIILISFFVGQHFYKVYNIDKPIKEEIAGVDGVKEVEMVNKDGKMDMILSLDPAIDFYHVYKEIEGIFADSKINDKGSIIIKNESNSDLDNVYYRLHYAIYEGIKTNKFVTMEENVAEIVEESEFTDYKLWIDNEAVYFQLNGDETSLYKKISYNKTITVHTEGGGSNG
ncbi:MAG: hypothetical protein FH762_11835 [Firmicutes bacterium]|nr:hypothetical protein [Bacillota bacterium]